MTLYDYASRFSSGSVLRMQFLVIGLAAVMVSDVSIASTRLEWSEEVKLHDGRTIVVKRHTEIGSSGFPVSRRGPVRYYHFCYAPMGIQWKSKAAYFPETFDIVDNKAYVKVSLGDCISCMLHGYPKTNALYFVWKSGLWKKIDFKEYPQGLRYNMLRRTHFDRDTLKDVHGRVTAAEKMTRDVTIHHVMKIKGISGLNELPGRSEMCEKCRGTTVNSPQSAEIFLPIEKNDCN